MRKPALIAILLIEAFSVFSQKIVDPCFISIKEPGMFYGSSDIRNLCKCGDDYVSADLLEWDPKANYWLGAYYNSFIYLEPPPGCNVRAMWMGNSSWTGYGEAFALRVDKSFQVGKTYSYTFTYASAGNGDNDNFSPTIYTDDTPDLYSAYKVGNLPSTDGWRTDSITFTASKEQENHNWLIIHTIDCSGMVLSNCYLNNPLTKKKLLSAEDTTFCIGDEIELIALTGDHFQYKWNTGDQIHFILAKESGTYSVDVQYYKCHNKDSVTLSFQDCEVRLDMPNIFTPNGDTFNETFKPKNYNYIAFGKTRIYNRWGKEIYFGNMFDGWDGMERNVDASPGIYFYEVTFTDPKGKHHLKKGTLTLVR